MSNVREFINKLDENVMKLGLDPKFKENPAYKKVLDEVYYYISEMNMGNDIDRVWVLKDEDGYKIEYKSPSVDKKYNLKIGVFGKSKLFCREIIESRNKSGIKEKTVDVTKSRLIGDCIEIRKDNGVADNINCEPGKCNTLCSSVKKVYDKYGVQEIEERESFNPSQVYGDIDRIDENAILANTYQAFNSSLYWRQRTIARRVYLDVVNINYEDKNTGEQFIGKQELNQSNGLQDLSFSLFHLSEHEVIHPLMTAEIEDMLSKEDPKVAEGLRRYAEGRETFSYDSENSKECLHRIR